MNTLIPILFFLQTLDTEKSFIESYNRHIDPLGKLDTTHFLRMRNISKIDGTLNGGIIAIDHTTECRYRADGFQLCFSEKKRKPWDVSMLLPPDDPELNIIKSNIGFLSPNVHRLSYQTVTDSIVVIEENSAREIRYHTFDRKTKHLLQTKSKEKEKDMKGERVMNYYDYRFIDGVLFPMKITYQNDFCVATLILLEASFAPFSETIGEDVKKP